MNSSVPVSSQPHRGHDAPARKPLKAEQGFDAVLHAAGPAPAAQNRHAERGQPAGTAFSRRAGEERAAPAQGQAGGAPPSPPADASGTNAEQPPLGAGAAHPLARKLQGAALQVPARRAGPGSDPAPFIATAEAPAANDPRPAAGSAPASPASQGRNGTAVKAPPPAIPAGSRPPDPTSRMPAQEEGEAPQPVEGSAPATADQGAGNPPSHEAAGESAAQRSAGPPSHAKHPRQAASGPSDTGQNQPAACEPEGGTAPPPATTGVPAEAAASPASASASAEKPLPSPAQARTSEEPGWHGGPPPGRRAATPPAAAQRRPHATHVAQDAAKPNGRALDAAGTATVRSALEEPEPPNTAETTPPVSGPASGDEAAGIDPEHPPEPLSAAGMQPAVELPRPAFVQPDRAAAECPSTAPAGSVPMPAQATAPEPPRGNTIGQPGPKQTPRPARDTGAQQAAAAPRRPQAGSARQIPAHETGSAPASAPDGQGQSAEIQAAQATAPQPPQRGNATALPSPEQTLKPAREAWAQRPADGSRWPQAGSAKPTPARETGNAPVSALNGRGQSAEIQTAQATAPEPPPRGNTSGQPTSEQTSTPARNAGGNQAAVSRSPPAGSAKPIPAHETGDAATPVSTPDAHGRGAEIQATQGEIVTERPAPEWTGRPAWTAAARQPPADPRQAAPLQPERIITPQRREAAAAAPVPAAPSAAADRSTGPVAGAGSPVAGDEASRVLPHGAVRQEGPERSPAPAWTAASKAAPHRADDGRLTRVPPSDGGRRTPSAKERQGAAPAAINAGPAPEAPFHSADIEAATVILKERLAAAAPMAVPVRRAGVPEAAGGNRTAAYAGADRAPSTNRLRAAAASLGLFPPAAAERDVADSLKPRRTAPEAVDRLAVESVGHEKRGATASPATERPPAALPAAAADKGQPVPMAPVDLGRFIAAEMRDAAPPPAASAVPVYAALQQAARPGGMRQLDVRLHPAELGSVTARIRMTGKQLSVEISAETPDALRQLSGESDTIRQALEALGFAVDQLTIQLPPSGAAPDRQADAAPRDAAGRGFSDPGSAASGKGQGNGGEGNGGERNGANGNGNGGGSNGQAGGGAAAARTGGSGSGSNLYI